jgi:hypothetical protein
LIGNAVTAELVNANEIKMPRSLDVNTISRRLFSDYPIREEYAIYSTINVTVNFDIMMAIVQYNQQPQLWLPYHRQ